jgi:hypothetical protein
MAFTGTGPVGDRGQQIQRLINDCTQFNRDSKRSACHAMDTRSSPDIPDKVGLAPTFRNVLRVAVKRLIPI